MNVLSLNCGSSSLKYRLIAMPAGAELAGGEAQRIGPPTAEPSRVVHRVPGREAEVRQVVMHDHAAAFEQIMQALSDSRVPLPDAVGHRIVHGGSFFRHHSTVDDAVLARLEKLGDLAPLHNPPAVRLLKACRQRYPDLPQVAVFDTVFHASIPEYASVYALPKRIRADLGIRKYGFHGISHEYVATEAARILQVPLDRLNAVSCHLGSGGASLCAIVGGRSVDNTMGYSPLQGLIMSTRCGDLDPAVVLQLLALSDGDPHAVEKTLNERSGVLGLSGKTADIRDVLAGAANAAGHGGRMDATANVYLWRLRKYLGSYLAVVGRPQAVIFTDTIGETVPEVRWAMCADLDAFGVKADAGRNRRPGPLPADIAAPNSQVRILVIATNEELAIARSTFALVAAPLQPAEKGTTRECARA
jgi:acetate kinase